MRRARQDSSTWPFLLVLAVLLVFTATAPRKWERTARRQSMGELLPAAVADDQAAVSAPRRHKSLSIPSLTGSRPIEARIEPVVTRQALPILEQPLVMQAPEQPTLAIAEPAAPPSEPLAVAPEPLAIAPEPPAVVPGPPIQPEPELAALPDRASDPDVEQKPAKPAPAVEPWWPVPYHLLSQLDALKQQPAAGAWATRAAALVRELIASGSPADGQADAILVELQSLAAAPGNFLAASPTGAERTNLHKAQFALSRRLDIWRRVIDRQMPTAQQATADHNAERLALCVAEVENQTPQDAAGASWREYLLLDALKQLAVGHNDADQRKLAHTALRRLENAALSASQREFLASKPIADLRTELRSWATEPVDGRQLLEHLEKFEQTGFPSHAQLLAVDFSRLAASTSSADEELARWIDTDYRNANVRISLSPEFLNRLVPPQQPRFSRVKDLFMGHPTEGWSSTDTRVGFRLIPDPLRLHVALEARGETYSEADTSNGPVVLHTHSDSQFVGWKEVTIGADGVRSVPAVAEAESSPRLRWVKSDLDFIPIVGSVVRDIARNQHEESQEKVRSQTRRKIRREVTEQIDSQLAPRIARANDRLQQRLIDPLEGLGIEAVMIEARTSTDRLTTRLRLAGESQLAGSGPRPRAPAGCLASVQMHESLLNNICQQLHWEGKTLTLAKMREELGSKLRMELGAPPANLPQDLTVTFAAENAIHLVCDEGHIQLNLAFARLQKSPESFRDFVVRVHYKPDLDLAAGRFVRDGTVQLIGERLRPKAQLALRGIFSKAFPPSRSMPIIPAGITARPGLADLRVVQCDIRDGWIGLAFDRPRANAAEAAVARQPAENR